MSDLMIRVDGNQIKQVLLGGSYLDTAETGACTARKPPTPAWNATDPNIPKSPWWLADGSFIGFRVVCDVGPAPVRDAATRASGPIQGSTTACRSPIGSTSSRPGSGGSPSTD